MIAEPFTADPALPGLEAAGDPDSMLRHFGEHLRPAGETAYEIRDCSLSRVRLSQGPTLRPAVRPEPLPSRYWRGAGPVGDRCDHRVVS